MSREDLNSSSVLNRNGETAAASSAAANQFAEARQGAEQAAVRPLFGARSTEGARGSAAGVVAPQAGSQAATSSARPTSFEEGSAEAKQAAVRPLLSAAQEPALSGTGFTYRHNWGPRRGQWTLRLNWGDVNARSRVLVSISEGAAGGPDAGKFIGAARYSLHNVAPRDGGVDIWVNIEWSSDILLYADYLVVNP